MERFRMMFIIFFTLLPTYMCQQNCPAGSQFNPQISRCQACRAGTFKDEYMQSCSPCLAGTYAPFESSTSCITCNAGTYQPNSGSYSPCMDCRPNTYTATPRGSSSCTPCPNGLLSDAGSGYSYECTAQCPAGMFGVERCESCPVGTYNQLTRRRYSRDCQPCGDGFTSPLQSISSDQCKPNCPAGHYGSVWTGGSSSVACTPCPAGTYNDKIGQTGVSACTQCQIGTASLSGGAQSINTCRMCMPGSYADNTGMSVCNKCPIGTVNGMIGSTSKTLCEVCGVGTYTDNPGDSVCKECLRDKYCKQGISYDCDMNRVSDVSSQESSDCTCKPGFFDPTKIGL